ncbi:MAG TPA: GMC family oxidoreductase N-terminal domain-containing protein [Longimicrobiales bacterium]|nr:GMC family oxidoreductase N-terminal domain-containing protein [Longimicrobiales bacterium]
MSSEQFDAIIVGSGPGGAGIARDMSRAGRRVLILERGRDWRGNPLYGTYAGALLYAEKRALLFTKEGVQIVRPLMVGGATSMYAGCSAPPPDWLHERHHVDVRAEAAELHAELGVAPLAPELRGAGSTRIADAAISLGMDWRPQDKFMLPARARPFDCGARCLLGCRCGAKWTAGEFVDDAVAAGAVLRSGSRVSRVIVEDGVAMGVAGRGTDGAFEYRAPHIILAGGGLGTPMLLRTAGIDAGHGVAMDTTVMVYGSGKVPGMGEDPPMTWSCVDPELDVMYSTLIDPWLMYPIIMAVKGAAWPLTWPRWGHTLGVMIKVRDEVSGGIDARGRVSKGLSRTDALRLERAEEVARRILVAAGCRPDSLIRTPLRGTHPSATARIGDVVNAELGTGVRGLYVCDASVFPEALGRPTVLTILALARRLARRLTMQPAESGGR